MSLLLGVEGREGGVRKGGGGGGAREKRGGRLEKRGLEAGVSRWGRKKFTTFRKYSSIEMGKSVNRHEKGGNQE